MKNGPCTEKGNVKEHHLKETEVDHVGVLYEHKGFLAYVSLSLFYPKQNICGDSDGKSAKVDDSLHFQTLEHVETHSVEVNSGVGLLTVGFDPGGWLLARRIVFFGALVEVLLQLLSTVKIYHSESSVLLYGQEKIH